MAKDPAFLFYPGDFMGGTMGFNRQCKGAYIDLMMGQFNMGRMTLEEVQDILGTDDFNKYWESKLKNKFVCLEGKYFNKRLEYEIERRKTYTATRRDNLSGKATENKKPKNNEDTKIPTEEEFLNYCFNEFGIEYEGLKFSLASKYKTWIDAGWKDGNNHPIKNWKNKIKNVVPHLKPFGNGTQYKKQKSNDSSQIKQFD